MTDLVTLWQSPDGEGNRLALRTQHPHLFEAISEIDALGHRQLQRIATAGRVASIGDLVGIAILRRAITSFIGLRHLLEASAIEPAKIQARAQFEIFLAYRYIMFGGRRRVAYNTPCSVRGREARARAFHVAAERRSIYSRQALLDGRWGLTVRRENRARIREEIDSNIRQLRKGCPSQWRAFGPLACHPSLGRKARYVDTLEWFSLGFRNPDKVRLRHLAVRLGQTWEYELLYGAFSGLVHPRGIRHDVEIDDKQLKVLSPYFPEAFELLGYWSCHWQLYIVAWASKAFTPGAWSDTQETFTRISPLLDKVKVPWPGAFA